MCGASQAYCKLLKGGDIDNLEMEVEVDQAMNDRSGNHMKLTISKFILACILISATHRYQCNNSAISVEKN